MKHIPKLNFSVLLSLLKKLFGVNESNSSEKNKPMRQGE